VSYHRSAQETFSNDCYGRTRGQENQRDIERNRDHSGELRAREQSSAGTVRVFARGAAQSLGDFTQSQGWLLPEHLRFRDGEDDDASGADWDLPDLNRMLAAARQKEFQVLVVPDFDRFARSLVKGLVLEEQLKKYGVRVVYQRVPLDDSPEGRLLKNQLFSFAEFEREKIALRTMMGRRRKAQTGMVVGVGPAPYGFRFTYDILDNGRRRVSGLEHDPLTAPIAREILRSLCTWSTLDVMIDLNQRGVPGPSGKDWNATTLYRMGLNPVYVGTWVYGKNGHRSTPENPVGIPVAVPALITRGKWDDIARAFTHRNFARRGRQPIDQDRWLLRGLLTCGHCHGAIRTPTTTASGTTAAVATSPRSRATRGSRSAFCRTSLRLTSRPNSGAS
jgi:DNA invertase Pin-like site-specific DNA recombinase